MRSTSVAPGSWVTGGVPIVYRSRTSRTRSDTGALKVTVLTGRWANDGIGVPVVARRIRPIRSQSVPAPVNLRGMRKLRLKPKSARRERKSASELPDRDGSSCAGPSEAIVRHGPSGVRATRSSPRTKTGVGPHRRYARTIVGLRATSGTDCVRSCTSWVTSTASRSTNGSFGSGRGAGGAVTAPAAAPSSSAPSSSASTWSTRAAASPSEASGSSTGTTRATASSTACANASSSRRLCECWISGIVRPMVTLRLDGVSR